MVDLPKCLETVLVFGHHGPENLEPVEEYYDREQMLQAIREALRANAASTGVTPQND